MCPQLIFNDENLNLTVGAIYISGKMWIGGPLCRMASSITITFPPSYNVPSTDLGLQVRMGGSLDIHGAYFTPTWTRLSSTAQAGNNWVSLQSAVNWRPGQLVVITTSIFRDEYDNQNEVMRISSVSADGKTLVFPQALRSSHYGGSEYQCEVGLLSRNILLQASEASEATRQGARVEVMGQGRFRGVAAYRMGQRNMLGGYPFHWHLLGTIPSGSSYAQDCSVYHSYFRCFAIHGTSNLVLQENVAFHVDGSCFYLEDGVEEQNVFLQNLAAFIHVIGVPASGPSQSGTTHYQSADLLNPADAAASPFYISNANNAFINNAASGGFSGYNFIALPAPIGPNTRPLKLFTGNTAHSTGYFWAMSGGIYAGGNLALNSSNLLTYSSGRDDLGNPQFMTFTNNKVWLAQWSISHWGKRARVVGWEAHDAVRGANLFGVSELTNAWINAVSGNTLSQFPGVYYDLAPVAGFQWYDTRVMTVLNNITFSNFAYQPELLGSAPSVFFSMVASDEYKPAFISGCKGITFKNVDQRALVRSDVMDTGSSRCFNFIDFDGSATQRGRASIIGSYPTWWNLGSDCTAQSSFNTYFCDLYPWRGVARLDVRVPGFTAQVDSPAALSPSNINHAGYVASFGHWGADARTMIITKNEGITGVTGAGGWYVHFDQGASPYLQVFLTQISPGTSILFATRYPAGTTFSIQRVFRWYPDMTSNVLQVNSLQAVLTGGGETYYFSGHILYIKMVDPGDASVDPSFTVNGSTIWGTRYFSAWYAITASNMGSNCTGITSPTFCYMTANQALDIPPALDPSYLSWVIPYCLDIEPPGPGISCAMYAVKNACNSIALTNATDPHVAVIGGYCAASCGRCQLGTRACVDLTPPGGLSCSDRRSYGNCGAAWIKAGGFCAATCGICTPLKAVATAGAPAPTCSDTPYTDGNLWLSYPPSMY
ncbi:MAG: hypothetical protein WDW36_007766 [Sanguina aurantia]